MKYKKNKVTLLDKPVLFKDPSYGKKVLLVDIETAPNLAYVWGKWEQDVIAFKEHWYMMSYAYKWLGEKTTRVVALPDFRLYKREKSNDRELVKSLWELFNEADVIIAHNGDAFDIKKSNARFIQHRLEPPMPYKTIDTLKWARKYFKFDSNKLDDLGDYLKVGRKVQTGGFHLWLGCIAGDNKAWDKMREYNKYDVILLENIYYKIRGWAKGAPNMNLLLGGSMKCPTCGSEHTIKRGYSYTQVATYQQYQCKNCGCWPRGEKIKTGQVLLR